MSDAILIPDHELLQRIGRGSYGEVWLARNVMGQGRAVKIVRRDAFDSSRPFEREFAAIRRYEPVSRQVEGLVNVLHVGRNDAEALFYYVMELADALPEGEIATFYQPRTLSAELAARTQLPAAECLDIALSLARALGTLHRVGLVHRDIKPSNIIFVHGQAKLADIGLVGELGESRSFVGTEGYIPPEGPGQPSADFYALGRVLYEALTGQEPRRFPLLPAESLQALAPLQAQELMEVLLRAGESDPARRYQSAGSLLADLALIQSGSSVRHLHRMERRWKVLKRGLVPLVLLLFLAASGWLWANHQAQRERGLRQATEAALSRAQRAGYRLQSRAHDPSVRQPWLEIIASAAPNGPDPYELRNDAIAALASTGLHETARFPMPVTRPRPAINADFTRLAMPQPNGGVQVLDTATHQVLAVLNEVAAAPTYDVLCDAAGQHFSIHDHEGKLRVYDPGKPATPLWVQDSAGAEDYFPKTQEMLIMTANGEGLICDLLTGAPKQAWTCPDAAKMAASVSPMATTVACFAEDDLSLLLHHFKDQTNLRIPLPARINAYVWAGDDQHLLAGFPDGNLAIVAATSPPAVRIVSAHGDQITQVASDPTGALVASTAWDRITRLTSTATEQPVALIPGWGIFLAFSADGQKFARHDSVSREFIIYDLERTPVRKTVRVDETPHPPWPMQEVAGLGFSPDGRWLSVGSSTGLYLLSAQGQVQQCIRGGACASVQFSPDQKTLWAATDLGLARYAIETESAGKLHFTKEIWLSGTPCSRLATAGNFVAGTLNSEPILWRNDAPAIRLTEPKGWHAIALSPDQHWLACGSRDGGAQVWSVDNAQPMATFNTPGEWTQLTFSPDSQSLYVGSSTGVTCYQVITWQQRWHTPTTNQGGSVTRLTAAPSGDLLAAVLELHEITLLNPHTGQPLARLPLPDMAEADSLAFSPNSETLAIGLNAPLVTLWDLRRLHEELRGLGLDWK